MAARGRFTRERLQQAALKIVDRHGLAALSMRSLAAALGAGAMTLYTYLHDREDLDALVVEAAMAEGVWPSGESADWRADVRAITEAMWQVGRRHPNVVPLILTRRVMHETTLAPAEALLQALSRGGRSGADLLAAFRTLSGFVSGLAQAQFAGVVAPPSGAAKDPNIARGQRLPADRFPKLVEIAHAAATVGPEYEFRAGLEIILRGLVHAPSAGEGRVSRKATKRRRGRLSV